MYKGRRRTKGVIRYSRYDTCALEGKGVPVPCARVWIFQGCGQLRSRCIITAKFRRAMDKGKYTRSLGTRPLKM